MGLPRPEILIPGSFACSCRDRWLAALPGLGCSGRTCFPRRSDASSLACELFLVLRSAVSLQAPGLAHIWQPKPLYLSAWEDKDRVASLSQDGSDWPSGGAGGRKEEEMASSEVIHGQREDNCVSFVGIKCLSGALSSRLPLLPPNRMQENVVELIC